MTEMETAEMSVNSPAVVATKPEDWTATLAKWAYPLALAAALSMWFLALRAPLWLDETLSYWQVSGGFAKVWTRTKLMPSSLGYLYTLWCARSILGSSEMALKIPSMVALFGAVYFLFCSAREMFDRETAYMASIFFALQYNVVFAATDARPYGFALLATCVAIFTFVRWMKGREMRQAIAFGAAAAGILYFHYLFGSILPAFAICYLVARFRSIRQDLKQLAALLGTFVVLIAPLIYRVASLYHTRDTHIVQKVYHPFLVGLNNIAPLQLLVGFVATGFLAALVRKIELPESDSFRKFLLFALLAFVPASILFGVNTHLIQPRYFSVVTPGSALMWAWLTKRISSRVLRLMFCTGLVGLTVYQTYSSPSSRHHALSFKEVHEIANRSIANEDATVIVCSAFVESNYEPLPTSMNQENPLLSQVDYYPVNAAVIFMPTDLNETAVRIARETVLDAAQQHRRILLIAPPTSYPTAYWIADNTRGSFLARRMGYFDEIMLAEYRPVE